MKVALDVDSTLAATNIPAFDYLEDGDHDLTYDDIETWDWGAERWGLDEFLGALHNAWVYDVEDIPPMEDDLPETVDRLKEEATVHAVTHQPDDERITEGKVRWLDINNIRHDVFRPVDRDVSKAELDYDVYIDDKPTLPANVDGDATVYLIDHAYNQDAEGDYIRVDTVKDAVNHILANQLAKDVERAIQKGEERLERHGIEPSPSRSESDTQELINEVNEFLEQTRSV